MTTKKTEDEDDDGEDDNDDEDEVTGRGQELKECRGNSRESGKIHFAMIMHVLQTWAIQKVICHL